MPQSCRQSTYKQQHPTFCKTTLNYLVCCRLICRYPHEEAGQIPVALVVRQPGSKVTEAQVMDHVAKRVAPYKKIRKVLFVDSIPKSPAGKILRRQLTNHVQAGAVSRM